MSRRSLSFLLDANIFIEAHRRYYALDLCPGFWACIEHYCKEGTILSLDKIQDELTGEDALSRWVKGAPAGLFISATEPTVIDSFRELMEWVQTNTRFTPDARAKFAREADGWLIAYARVHKMIVVTHESKNPDRSNKVLVPNVCSQFSIPVADTFEMLKNLEVKFRWQADNKTRGR